MRRLGLACAFALVIACDDDDLGFDPAPPSSGIDASTTPRNVDAGEYVSSVDGAVLAPTCPPFHVCTDNKPGLLYNVCVSGTASAVPAQPACLVDDHGTLYLAPLASSQLAIGAGWTQSNNASLSPTDQARCDAARAALSFDAGMPPKCLAGPLFQ